MVKIRENDSAPKQMAYARALFSDTDKSRRQIARSVGYTEAVSNSVISKIESKQGFQNALVTLAKRSNDLIISIFDELDKRNLSEFSNKEIIGMLTVMESTWERFNKGLYELDKPETDVKARLRTIVLQNINKQVNMNPENQNRQIETESAEDKSTDVEFSEVPQNPIPSDPHREGGELDF